MTGGKYEALPQGEPNLRHLLMFPRQTCCLLTAHVVIDTLEDGGQVIAPKNNAQKTVNLYSQLRSLRQVSWQLLIVSLKAQIH